MELFKQIFDLASEGILILNSDGIIQKINSSCAQIFGYSKNEILQKNVSILISPIDIDVIKLNSKKTTKTSFNSYGFKKSGLQFPLILKSEITQINKGTQIILFVTDLTTSKLKTETLIANKKHIEETQNIAHIGSWFWNLQTNEKDWSGEFYKIYDLEPNDERLNPDNVTQFIHPDDKEEAITKVTKAIKNHQPFECENRIVTQKGNIKHTISKGKAIYNKNGEPIYIMGTLQDVTELKKTTIELTESNRKFDALISNLPGLAYRSKNDKDRTTEYMSRGCFTITGYKPEQFISKKIKFGNIIVPDDKDFVWEELQKALAKKTTFNIEYRIQHKNRNLKNVWEQGKGIFDDQGNLLGIEGFILDITEKKQTEEKLRANEAKNKALLEAIPDIMLIQDLKGDFLDVYANQPEMLIVPKNEIIGKNMVDILPNKLFKKIKKAHQRALKTKQIQIENFEINNKGKAEMHESRIVLLNNHKILSIVRDITNQKKLEKELKQSEAKKTAILQALPDLIFVLSEKGSVLEIHESDSSVLFTPKEDLLGKNIKTLLPKKGSQKLTEALSKVLKTKKMEVLELSLLANNSIVKYETRMVPLEDNKILTIARDITKNKEIEELLSIRNKALEFAMNGIIIVDAKKEDAPIIYCNKSFSELTGYSKDEIIGKNCRFLQNDDRDQKEILIMKSAIEEGKPCQVVLRNYRKDGSMFWNELNITPIFSNTGKPTHFIGVQKDVTARKKALILKDQIRKILEMITQNKPIKQIGDEIVKTLKNNLSNSIPSMLLLNNEKKTLHNLSSVNLPNNYKKSIEGLAIGSKTGSCGTAAYLKKDVIVTNIANDPLWKNFKNNALKHNLKSCWSFPIYSSTNTVLGVLAVYSSVSRNPNDHELQLIADINQLASVAIEQHTSNITLHKNNIKLQEYTQKLEENVQNRTNELSATVQQLVETNLNLEDQVQITKEAEKLANTSQAMFSAIAKNFPKGIIVVVNENFEIIYIEGAELHKIGLGKVVTTGVKLNEITAFSDKRKSRIKSDILRTLNGEHLSFQVTFNNNTYSVNSTPLFDENETIKHALFVYSDISEQKRVELEILNSLRKEQELNELKSRFISMASHEFRTPLSAILSSAILIEKQNEPGKEAKRERYVSMIRNNVKNLVVILNDFLSLGKLEEGKVLAQSENFELINFLKSLIEEIEVNTKDGQTIKISTNAATIEVYLDPKLIRHIVTNLVSNAIKYSSSNDKIIINIKENTDQLTLEVVDYGIGIPLDEQKNLFNRFFRAKNATNIQGTGLGLYIVKQYIELIGGNISFSSVLNEGTIFTVNLPMNHTKNEKNIIDRG